MSSKVFPWQSAEFLSKILKKSENDESIEVKDLTTTSAVGNGDNFASQVLRIAVKYLRDGPNGKVLESISLIVKVSPMVESSQKEMLTMYNSFGNEIDMMKTRLIEMTDILNEEGCQLGPRFLYAEDGDISFIVMEDLTSLGYRMGDRLTGFDLEHSLLAMRSLAKLHASSIALSEKDASLAATYNKKLYSKDGPIQGQQFLAGGLKNLSKECRNWTELGSDRNIYADKLLKLSEVIIEKMSECLDPKNCDFRVLNHGDYWINNMLVRYDDAGKVKNQIFIDFQMPKWNTPALDLIYFLDTSLSDDVQLHHREELLNEYLNTLTTTMSKVGCKTKPPTSEGLDKILKDWGRFSVISTCVELPIVLISRSEVVDFSDFGKVQESLVPAYKGERYRKIMCRRLPEYNALGLLDV